MYEVTLTIRNRETHTSTVLTKVLEYLPAVQSWIFDGHKWLDGTGFVISGYTVKDVTEGE